MILEVCVDSFESMKIAKSAGANRIELCSALNLGGLTPSFGLMKQAKSMSGIEVFVMIRPRSGDFLYSDFEIETMKGDIEIVKRLGFDGIVTGILQSDGQIDLKRMDEIIKLAHPLKVVFHRAFDHARNPLEAMETLIEMGICRILTSGQRETALEGAKFIAQLQRNYGDRITIMPGGGIHADSIKPLIESTKCTNYHMSGRVQVDSGMSYRESIHRKNTPPSEYILERASFDRIKAVRDVLDNFRV